MRTLILGFDAFDPKLFERLLENGQLPNLARYVNLGGYSPFAVSNPPQSEVSWTSIATGLNPGGHGIFDFVHRDPKTYTPFVSLLPTKRGVGGTHFTRPFNARTIFDQAARKGFQATALWWPAMFPARLDSPVHTLPGLGTPDIHGKLGVGTLFTSDADSVSNDLKTAVEPLQSIRRGSFRGELKGPTRQKRSGVEETLIPLELDLVDVNHARLKVGSQMLELVEGQWSSIIEVTFKMGLLVKVGAVTRVILTRTQPDVRLYFLPLQIHPLHSIWRYGAPRGFVKHLWNSHGPFLTVGWPQDTTALEEGCINDAQFLELSDSILEARERVLMSQLENFQEGILAVVFDSLDRVQHMFWRDRQDVIETWYLKLDAMVGRVEKFLDRQGREKPRVLIVSDHGFADFDHKVHLNRWLIDNGYLFSKSEHDTGSLQDVDWSRSQAYALGLNSLYLNLSGREGEGKVELDQVEPLLAKLINGLTDWRGPDNRSVVTNVTPGTDALSGALAEYGPDLLVGFGPGYRASSQTGLGQWEKINLEPNQDHWGADHCIDPNVVPGVLFSNLSLDNFPNPSYLDFPAIAIGEDIEPGIRPTPPPSTGDENQAALEERLKSLGYL